MHWRIALLAALAVFAGVSRVTPHPPNVTAMIALCAFCGMRIKPLWLAFSAPLLVMLVTDVMLFRQYDANELIDRVAIYGVLLLCVGMSCFFRGAKLPLAVAGTLAGSVLFFLGSNFLVWSSGTLYPLTWKGLAACYAAGIPFFHWPAAGDGLLAVLFFGADAALAKSLEPSRQPAVDTVAGAGHDD